MKKFVCPICGYVLEAESIPAGFVCPQCKCPGEKFKEQTMTDAWASEHIVGIASDVPEEIKEGLRANFEGECSEVGMYLAMAIPKSACIGKRLLMKKQSTQQSSQSCWAK